MRWKHREEGGESAMGLDLVTPGNQAPEVFNVIIEIPMAADPIKYEVDKQTGALFVDRFMGTSMHYPCNYGYVPRTIADDGDPVDVLVITPFPLIPGVVVRCRPLGSSKSSTSSSTTRTSSPANGCALKGGAGRTKQSRKSPRE
jgi:hypothetical protein